KQEIGFQQYAKAAAQRGDPVDRGRRGEHGTGDNEGLRDADVGCRPEHSPRAIPEYFLSIYQNVRAASLIHLLSTSVVCRTHREDNAPEGNPRARHNSSPAYGAACGTGRVPRAHGRGCRGLLEELTVASDGAADLVRAEEAEVATSTGTRP